MRRSKKLAAVVEGLEIRRLLATITVTSTADSITPNDGAVTLREAITAINAGNDLGDPDITAQNPAATNAFGTKDTIDFNIPATGLQTIAPTSELPAITAAVTIDGYSQPGSKTAFIGINDGTEVQFPATFGVAIDGSNTDAASGFTVEAQNVTIDGLMIYKFTGNDSGTGIYLTTGSSSDSIWGDYIGTDGTQGLGNDAGIVITNGSSNDTIGGTTIDKRNVISGSSDGAGIAMYRNPGDAGQVTGNVIEGNYIGTDATGATSIANRTGITMSRTEDTTIGGTTPGARNVISGNTEDGIELDYYAENTTVEGNYIGVTADGSSGLGNSGDGVSISVAPGCTIGSTVAGEGNVISDNGNTGAGTLSGNGIEVDGGPSATIINNFIGTDATGKKAIGNRADGILISGEGSMTIGGTDANTRNVISGNTNGIELTGASSDSTIEGNFIGTDVTGTSALGNSGSGIVIDQYANDNTVGGTTAAARNIISGNSTFGVAIDGATDDYGNKTTGNIVEGNYIGTDVTGENALDDGNAGVYMDLGAQDNTIGGTDPGAGNVISGISGVGIYIAGAHINYSGGTGGGATTNSNTIQGNYIGTDPTGTKQVAVPFSASPPYFAGNGIYLDTGTYGNLIGGNTAAARNIISGNATNGVVIAESATTNTVEGNYIGVDVTGSKALGNGFTGIEISSNDNIIGGTAAGAGNVVSGNGIIYALAGIDIDGGSNDVVQGNDIGTDATGTMAIGNLGDGVLIESVATDNTVGGNRASAQNIIAFNTAAGVVIRNQSQSGSGGGTGGVDSTGNTVRLNSIFSNADLGIDLGDDGITPNDPHDADTGANNLQNFPVIVTATSTGSSVTLSGTFNSLPSTNFTLDFYANDSADAHSISQGKQYLGSIALITDSGGSAAFSSTFNVAIGSNKYITATATDDSTAPYGSTSEFSQALEATAAGSSGGGGGGTSTPPTISIGDVSMDEGNSGTTAFTFTITRSGDLSGASSVKFATADGTATVADNDYQPQSNTIGFDPNQATKTITILVNGDSKVESDETFVVNLTNATGATIADGSATGTILNDDVQLPPPPPPPPALSINDVTHDEKDSGTHTFTFTVTRSGDVSGASDVYYSTTDGTATAGSDYAAIPLTALHFAANQTTASIVVTEYGDTTYEADETFFVNLSSPTNATISNSRGVGTIVNDDAAPPPPPASGSVSVITDPFNSSEKALDIIGTDNNDTITVTKSGSSQGKAVVKINGVNKGTFSFSGSILVYGKDGDDNISIDSGITRSAYVWGGDGNDTVNGGGGNDILFGEGNDDSLNGNGGRDILFGGDGTDKLNGGSGDDVLIAGDFKTTPTMTQLASIQKEWTRTDKAYSYRVSHLTNGGGYNTIKLNSSTLFSSTTLKDSLTGGADSDLFFAAMTGDKITDKASGETAVNIG